ncbi:MAG: M28 family peptidase [Opitutales bacterium]|nr:M28 family peptidase [Opitutales bacterium]
MTHFPKIINFFKGLALIAAFALPSQAKDHVPATMLGDAVLTESAYDFLETISVRFGPRMIGTREHEQTLQYLEQELETLGLESHRQTFDYPGWVRGKAEIRMTEPFDRPLRGVALGYVGPWELGSTKLAFVSSGDLDELEADAVRGRIVLTPSNVTFLYEDMVRLAEEFGAKGALYTNRVDGGQLLARTANHDGNATPFPVFSITMEEGQWMRQLIERGEQVEVSLSTTSKLETFTGSNLIATIPGESGERIIVGGHFDAWDLGQGAIDNGLGVAQLYEVARLFQAHSPENRHSIELVWFDAEEFGLWGSRYYAENVDLSDVRAMINLDMVGVPEGINAMGFDNLVPSLEAYADSLGSWEMPRGVSNSPWAGSDHLPFIFEGVPAITFYAPIDPAAVRYYHDLADTIDKVDRKMLAESSAFIALLVYHLANEPGEKVPHLSPEETADLLRDAGLEQRLRRINRWPF